MVLMSWSSLPFHCSKYSPCSNEGCRPKDSTVPRSRGDPNLIAWWRAAVFTPQLKGSIKPGQVTTYWYTSKLSSPHHHLQVHIQRKHIEITTKSVQHHSNLPIGTKSLASPGGQARRKGKCLRSWRSSFIHFQLHKLGQNALFHQKKKIKKDQKSHWNCCF